MWFRGRPTHSLPVDMVRIDYSPCQFRPLLTWQALLHPQLYMLLTLTVLGTGAVGIQLSPVTGLCIAQLIVDGKCSVCDLSYFSAARFSAVERDGTDAQHHDLPAGRLVTRPVFLIYSDRHRCCLYATIDFTGSRRDRWIEDSWVVLCGAGRHVRYGPRNC